MKNKLVLFITGCFALVLSSCLKSDEIVGVEAIKNCQIHTFSLSHDSVSGLDTVKFTIDQLTGRIFNIDSLPFGTKIEKVVCKIGFANSSVIGGVEASPEAYPDSTYYLSSLSDSIDKSLYGAGEYPSSGSGLYGLEYVRESYDWHYREGSEGGNLRL